MIRKRLNYINWDEYFMGIAILSSMRSKDPNTQVGACIVNPDNRIVGTGYNGLPRGYDDDEFDWTREGNLLESKYGRIIHAEPNAIFNATTTNLKDCKIYVTLHPCHDCIKDIVQKEISEIIYLEDKYKDKIGRAHV